MDERLAHLSEQQVEELIERYYNNEKVKPLLEEYKIDVKPSQLVKLFPPKVTDVICPYCNIHLEIKRSTRYYSWSKDEAECPACKHVNESRCRCENCKEKEFIRIQKGRKEKQDLLDSILNLTEEGRVEFETLTFDDRVYLGALLREGLSEDFTYIKPIQDFVNPFVPTLSYSLEVLKDLWEKKLIVIHPESDPDCFENINAETGNFNYNPYGVKWALNVKVKDAPFETAAQALIMPENIIEPELSYIFWKKVALLEAIEYFSYSMTSVLGVEYSAGDKTVTVLSDMLNHFSVSQIYSIIYRSVNNALRFKVERSVSKIYAANTVIGNAQSFAERAKIKNWEIQHYSRLKELPESALSRFFFERVLKIGSDGFFKTPRIIEQV